MTDQPAAFDIGLPKWPGHLVVGKAITPLQASELLIRTDHFDFSTNDYAWDDGCRVIVGAPIHDAEEPKRENGTPDWPKMHEEELDRRDKLQILPVRYLNNDRIGSCYVGGPNGWCDWEGRIFCNGQNVGKWPSVEEVFNEWVMIAEAFPFLDLEAQLLNDETCSDYTKLRALVTFTVKDGKVTVSAEPRDLITAIESDDMSDLLFAQLIAEGGERGLPSLAIFEEHVGQLRKTLAERAVNATN